MTITSVTKTEVKAEIDPNTRFDIENGKIGFYCEGWKSNAFHTICCFPEEGILKYSSINPLLKSRATQPCCREVTFKCDFVNTNYKPGNVLTIRDPAITPELLVRTSGELIIHRSFWLNRPVSISSFSMGINPLKTLNCTYFHQLKDYHSSIAKTGWAFSIK